jgi:metabolite-proton symporter
MATDSGDGGGRAGRRTRGRSLWQVIAASVVGTSLEWYDFFLYGTAAALVFGELFFPTSDPLVGTLLAFATYAVGFVARPIGGVVAGHLGDRIGRREVLVATLLVMGVATCAIGLLPTYDTIGVAAPILLVTLRFVQGLGLGGEWGGAVLMVSEHGDQRRRGLYASWPQVGVPAGNLLAAGILALLAAVLSDSAFTSWGWRVPFLLSALLVLVGLFIRLRIEESPLFKEVQESATRARSPIVDVVKVYPRQLAIAFGARLGTDVAFYVFALFIITYVTDQLGLAKTTALNAVLIGSAFQLFLIPAFGALSDRIGRRPVYAVGAAGALAWAFAFFPLLDTEQWGLIALAAVGGLFFHALMYGPQAAFISELFGTRVRYSGASLGYQLAGVAGGALAPIISTALLAAYDSSLAVSLYVAAALLVTLVALAVARETAGRDLEEVAEEEDVAEDEAPRLEREPPARNRVRSS